MSDVVDLTAERDRRYGPDAEFVHKDDFGRPMYLFALQYQMAGAEFGAQIWAYDMDDAQARVAGMRGSLELLGQIYQEIPAI